MWSFSPLEKLTSGVAENGGRKPRQREQGWGSLRVRPRPAPCRRGRTSQVLVTRRAPRDSRTQAQKSARSGLCPTAGAPGRRRARVSSGAWKRWGTGFLWLSSWDWTHWRARLFSCADGEKKFPLDLVGPIPLSSRACLMPPSHLLSGELASRWPGNYELLESRTCDYKVPGSWSCGQRAGGAGRLVLLARFSPCVNFTRCSRPTSCSAPGPHLLPSLQRR